MSPFENERRKRPVLIKIRERIDARGTVVCLIVAALFLGIGYIGKTNAAAGRGYEMKILEQQIREAERFNQNTELDIATRTASRELEQRARQLGLVEVKNVRYIANAAHPVVARK